MSGHKDLDRLNETLRAKVSALAKARQLVDRLTSRIPEIRKRRRELRKRLKGGRSKPHVVYERISPNRSSRGGVKPRLIVLHSTESDNRPGPDDLKALADYFAAPSTQASSHVLTDADGNSARCVPDSEKAWTQAYFNPWCLSVEQIGRASQGAWAEEELRETARWLAKWSRDFDVPLVRGEVSGSTIARAGVVTHKQLGSLGGGHSDPGDAYPVDRVIEMAKAYR